MSETFEMRTAKIGKSPDMLIGQSADFRAQLTTASRFVVRILASNCRSKKLIFSSSPYIARMRERVAAANLFARSGRDPLGDGWSEDEWAGR